MTLEKLREELAKQQAIIDWSKENEPYSRKRRNAEIRAQDIMTKILIKLNKKR